MSTGIIILNYNNANATINCIDSIERFNTASVKYIVVDNGSPDKETTKLLDRYFSDRFKDDYTCCKAGNLRNASLPMVTFVLNPVNGGYAAGNNLGLEQAYKDQEITDILLLNNDVLFIADIIPVLKKDVESVDKCGFITPVLLHKDGGSIDDCCARKFIGNWNLMIPFFLHRRDCRGWISKSIRKQKYLLLQPELLNNEGPFPIDYPSGSCMFIPKQTIKDIDGFDSDTFLYYEELILFKRLLAAGYQSYCDPRIKAIHLGGSTTKMSDVTFLQRCNLESADVYFRKYGNCSLSQKIAWTLTKMSWSLRLWMKDLLKRP